ncbi:MAG: ABC transporter permease [Xanthomonadales bacterium]|nr:ABC transporter permease [Xanthomonadales bacterium]
MLRQLINDARYSLRALLARPGFTLIAVLTLALGIGANTAIFSVINGMLLQPLPFPDSERLVDVHNSYPKMGLEYASSSVPDYLDRREQAEALDDLAMYDWTSYSLSTAGERAEAVRALRATPSLFSTLGVKAAMGRALIEDDGKVGNDHVVVLSDSLWRNRFNADPGLVGRDIRLNSEPYRVVGVMPAGFAFPDRNAKLWTSYAITPGEASDFQRGSEHVATLGRLKAGASIEQLESQMTAIIARNAERFIGMDNPQVVDFGEFLRAGNFQGRAENLHEQKVEDQRPLLLILQAAVGLVLLIACANTANLMLSRVLSRSGELSVRSALGASRARIASQLLVEALLLAMAGGALGVMFAYAMVGVLPLFGLGDESSLFSFSIDTRVLLFALGVSLLAGLLAALMPMLSLWRLDIHGSIKEGGRLGGGGRRTATVRSGLVVAQLALATTLLIGAGLLLKSFVRLQDQDPGFVSKGVITARIRLAENRFPDMPAQQRYFEDVLREVSAVPGVDVAGFTSSLPFSGSDSSGSYDVDGLETPENDPGPHGMQRLVSAGYFQAMEIPLKLGRGFAVTDSADAPPVVIIDQYLAHKFWPGESPIGKRLRRGDNQPWAEVVGVVGTVKHYRLSEAVEKETLYWPLTQMARAHGMLVIRSHGDPNTLIPALRDAILKVDPEQPVADMRLMTQRVADTLDTQRAPMLLVGLFAIVAIALASIGIYGVLAYSVNQRRGELGVRVAIGAGRGDILRLVLRQAGMLVVVGLVVGVLVAVFAGQGMSALLFGVSRFDPVVFIGVVLLLAVVALVACLLPARRAVATDPMQALRYE